MICVQPSFEFFYAIILLIVAGVVAALCGLLFYEVKEKRQSLIHREEHHGPVTHDCLTVEEIHRKYEQNGLKELDPVNAGRRMYDEQVQLHGRT